MRGPIGYYYGDTAAAPVATVDGSALNTSTYDPVAGAILANAAQPTAQTGLTAVPAMASMAAFVPVVIAGAVILLLIAGGKK